MSGGEFNFGSEEKWVKWPGLRKNILIQREAKRWTM